MARNRESVTDSQERKWQLPYKKMTNKAVLVKVFENHICTGLFVVILFFAGSLKAQMIEVREGVRKIYKKEADHIKYLKEKRDNADSITPLHKDRREDGNEDSEVDLEAVGNFTFNGIRSIPALKFLVKKVGIIDTVFGARGKPTAMGLYNSLDIFGLQDPLGDSLETRVNFLIPEYSSYGINYTLGACVKNYRSDKQAEGWILGLIGKASLLGKQFKTSYDSAIKESFIANSVLLSIGAELVFPTSDKNNLDLSVYINYNINKVLTNVERFKNALNTSHNRLDYSDTGIRTNFNVAPNTNIRIDLGFILTNKEVAAFALTKDEVIPMIRVGFRQTFSDNPLR